MINKSFGFVVFFISLLLACVTSSRTFADEGTTQIVNLDGKVIGACRTVQCSCHSWAIVSYNNKHERSGFYNEKTGALAERAYEKDLKLSQRLDRYFHIHDTEKMFASRSGLLCVTSPQFIGYLKSLADIKKKRDKVFAFYDAFKSLDSGKTSTVKGYFMTYAYELKEASIRVSDLQKLLERVNDRNEASIEKLFEETEHSLDLAQRVYEQAVQSVANQSANKKKTGSFYASDASPELPSRLTGKAPDEGWVAVEHYPGVFGRFLRCVTYSDHNDQFFALHNDYSTQIHYEVSLEDQNGSSLFSTGTNQLSGDTYLWRLESPGSCNQGKKSPYITHFMKLQAEPRQFILIPGVTQNINVLASIPPPELISNKYSASEVESHLDEFVDNETVARTPEPKQENQSFFGFLGDVLAKDSAAQSSHSTTVQSTNPGAGVSEPIDVNSNKYIPGTPLSTSGIQLDLDRDSGKSTGRSYHVLARGYDRMIQSVNVTLTSSCSGANTITDGDSQYACGTSFTLVGLPNPSSNGFYLNLTPFSLNSSLSLQVLRVVINRNGYGRHL